MRSRLFPRKTSIPKQLQNHEFRFVLLGKWNYWLNSKTRETHVFPEAKYPTIDVKLWKPLGKAPFEAQWQNNGYAFDNPKLIGHISLGNNYGVIGGHGNLRILDIDNKELAESLLKGLDTFCVKTGSGGIHFYFLSDYDTNHVFIDKKGEFRANNYQVVCPPCRHPSGNYYEVINDLPIKKLSKEEVIKLISPYLKTEVAQQQTNEKITSITISKDWLDKNIIPKINSTIFDLIKNTKTGEELQALGLSSRSERDEKIITSLLLEGFGQYIKSIFELYPCGDKYREHTNGEKYLEASIEKARKYSGVVNDKDVLLEKEIAEIQEKVLKNKLDEYLLKLCEVKNPLLLKNLLGQIAFKAKIPKKDLLERLNELKYPKIERKPISVASLLEKELPKTEFYINPLIPQGSIIALGGKAGKGKSLIVQAICIYNSLNRNLFGTFKIDKQPKILLYDLENGEHTLSYRLKYILNGLQGSCKELKNLEVLEDFDKKNIQGEIETAKGYDVIILDSYRRFLEGTENDSEVTDKFFNEYLKPLKTLGKTIIILHHFKKSNPEEFTDDVLMDLFRGSSDIPAQFDLIYGIFKSPERQTKDGDLTYNLSIAKIKNRLGLPIKDFAVKVVKKDFQLATSFEFLNYDKIKTQKEQVIDRIIELLSTHAEMKREEIIKAIREEFDCNEYNTMKYLTELYRERIIARLKSGYYSLIDKISAGEDKSQTKLT